MHISGKEQETYLRTCHCFVFLADHGENNMDYAATVAANLASVGFGMTKADVERLARCSREDIIRLYQDIKPVTDLQEAYSYRPFYPNFPQEVMEKDDIEIFIDQFLYAISGFELTPDKMEETRAAFPFMGETTVHPVRGVSQEEYRNDIRSLMKSSTSYIPCHITMLRVFTQEHPREAAAMTPSVEEMKQRENRIILGCILKEQGIDRALVKYCQTPTDVLRYAAVQSEMNAYCHADPAGGKNMPQGLSDAGLHSDDSYASVYQKAALQYDREHMPSFRLPRSDRRFCMSMLEKMSKGKPEVLAADMIQHKSEWKRMFNSMHYPEMVKSGAPTLAEASRMIRSNTPVDRYSSRVEKAVREGDLDTVLKETASRPGDFIRRFDKILRIGMEQGEPEKVLSQLKECAEKSGIAPVTSLVAHIQSRTKQEEVRSFTIEKSGTVWNTTEKNREPIPQVICDRVRGACMEGISEKFRGKGDMGQVYISPEMANYKVPASTRTLNEGVDVGTIGSVTPVNTDKDTLRLFIGWGNERMDSSTDDIDIDLTADIVTADGSVTHCGWNGDYSCRLDGDTAVVYSGDVRTGNPGEKATDCGCEYIDLKPSVLKDHMAQYVICGVSLYYGAESFRDMKHLDFGYMERDSRDHGELFDTRTVQTKQAIRNDSTVYVPMIYDVQKEQMISVNMSISRDSNVLSDEMKNIAGMLPIVQVKADQSMTLADLITVNALSNGTIVSDPSEADIVYMSKRELADYCNGKNDIPLKEGAQIHCQDDYAHISGTLMADPVPGTDLFHSVPANRQE